LREWRRKNPKKVKAAWGKWYLANPEKRKEVAKRWQKEHPEIVKKAIRKWRLENPDKDRLIQKRARIKRRNTANGKLNANISTAICRSLYSNKGGSHWEKIAGFTLEELKVHLEKKFTDGMMWNNYGKIGWEIDHIIPLAVFNFQKPTDIDFRKAWSLNNLRPLCKKENQIKNAKLKRPFQPSLTI
jgi:5-methylcytosine-specific restriction endonuclease McrA